MRTRIVALLLLTAFLVQLDSFARAGAHSFANIASTSSRRADVPAPEDVLGFVPGDDRKLASWDQVLNYFEVLAKASDRVKFETLGNSTMGKRFVMATISAPENLARLEEYQRSQELLADPRKLGRPSVRERKARELIARGKTIVLITCGIHSTEVGSYLSSILIAQQLASSNQPEIQNILRNTIILLVPSLNPDGVDIVKNWYDKTLGTRYEGTSPPELYNKYVGHDDNRDWYAFTQVETKIAVDKIHNVWHPQIVHDIHQQGEFGSRLFLPPYMPPVEPNVPKQIVEGYTELGNWMAREMHAQGFQGITTNSTYDAWSPARAYSHYHGGVRILSETASARLASPVNIRFDQLRSPDGYNPQKLSANFGPVWKGGVWHLRDITNYMTTAALLLLRHASEHREEWLRRFYKIGKDAVRPRNKGELFGFQISITPARHEALENTTTLLEILKRAGVEIENGFVPGFEVPREIGLVKTAQPYAAFARAILQSQRYPDLRDASGHPVSPYDVTAHSLALLMGVDVKPLYASPRNFHRTTEVKTRSVYPLADANRRAWTIYKSHVPALDEGWTRWTLEHHPTQLARSSTVEDKDVRAGKLQLKYNVVIIPDQSPDVILNGHRPGTMPPEYTGGLGQAGVKELREFVEEGGTVVCLNRASDFAIKQFKLPLRDVVADLPDKEFFVPGSILRIELDTAHPIAQGMPRETIAWVEDSPVFEVVPGSALPAANVHIIARYPIDKSPLLSGWLLGGNYIKGKAALVEVTMGKGRIILFGFRPQYRGQSLATYPLFFNAINGKY